MVRLDLLRQFLRNNEAVSLTEGLIVFPIMVLAIAAMIEFTYGMNQWSQAAKALQMGARKAAVSCPITGDFDTIFASDPNLGGQIIQPDSNNISTCGAGAGACDVPRLEQLVCGPDRDCAQTEANSNWQGMVVYFSRITPANVRVTYEQTGLGYHGRPAGPVVTVRLELRNATFDLPIIGVLLGFTNITVPSFPVTVTTEDLRNGTSNC